MLTQDLTSIGKNNDLHTAVNDNVDAEEEDAVIKQTVKRHRTCDRKFLSRFTEDTSSLSKFTQDTPESADHNIQTTPEDADRNIQTTPEDADHNIQTTPEDADHDIQTTPKDADHNQFNIQKSTGPDNEAHHEVHCEVDTSNFRRREVDTSNFRHHEVDKSDVHREVDKFDCQFLTTSICQSEVMTSQSEVIVMASEVLTLETSEVLTLESLNHRVDSIITAEDLKQSIAEMCGEEVMICIDEIINS